MAALVLISIISVFYMVPISGDDSIINWSTEDLTQQWFDEAAGAFQAVVEADVPYSEQLAMFDDDISSCSWFGCTHGLQKLIQKYEKYMSTELIKSFEPHFDLRVWSEKQCLLEVAYIFTGINEEKLVFTGTLMVRIDDDNTKFSHWIYTLKQSMLKQSEDFFNSLKNYKSDL